MNPDVKEKWIAALRSGEYEQGKTLLRSSTDQFCCLGVLCDLAVKEGVVPEPVLVPTLAANEGGGYSYGSGSGSISGLPEEVRVWAGIDSSLGKLPEIADGALATELARRVIPKLWLVDLNDVIGYDFDQIADVIEEYL